MKIKETVIIEDLVKRGINFGWASAFKHIENPSFIFIKDEILRSVLSCISEYFIFETKKIDKYLLLSDCIEEGIDIVITDNLEFYDLEEELKNMCKSSIMTSIQRKFKLSK